jgi:hypothetical protein
MIHVAKSLFQKIKFEISGASVVWYLDKILVVAVCHYKPLQGPEANELGRMFGYIERLTINSGYKPRADQSSVSLSSCCCGFPPTIW